VLFGIRPNEPNCLFDARQRRSANPLDGKKSLDRGAGDGKDC